MVDTRCWTKQFVADFIHIYKENPCLWQVRSSQHSNRRLRNEAYDKLVAFCKPTFPEANRDFVVKKIQSLRGSFRKEARKVLHSRGIDSSPEDVYVPSLWYYDLLLFTIDQDLPSVKVSNSYNADADVYLPDKLTEKDCGNDSDDYCSNGVNVGSPASSTRDSEEESTKKPCSSTEPEQQTTPELPKKRRRMVPAEETVSDFQESYVNASSASAANAEIKEYEAIGINVAKKLQRMDSVQALYAESIINTVLRRGLFNTLQDCTDLCDHHCNTLARMLQSRSPSPSPKVNSEPNQPE